MLGFAIVLPSGLDYWSDNYKWFTARFDRFLYLDRVVVAERGRRRGVGRALYDQTKKIRVTREPRELFRGERVHVRDGAVVQRQDGRVIGSPCVPHMHTHVPYPTT